MEAFEGLVEGAAEGAGAGFTAAVVFERCFGDFLEVFCEVV